MEQPKFASFTSPREITLVAPDGSRCHRFEAGETAMVHEVLWPVAVDKGLMPAQPSDLKEPPKQEVPPPPQEVTNAAGLLEACKTMIVRGNPADFTPTGRPRAASAKKLVDFEFTQRELYDAFATAMHEVEQDGDDGQEHSEPGVSAAE